MATRHYARKTLLAAKVNSGDYGADATPTAAANAMLVSDLQVTPYDAEVAQRNTTQPYMGGRQRITWGPFVRCSFGFELQGSGTPATAPAWAPLLQGCAFAQTARSDAAGTIGDKVAIGSPDGTFTYTKTTAYGGAIQRTVTLECTTGGGSGTAEFTVSAPAIGGIAAYSETGETMTDTTAFALPGDAEITPTIGTEFAVGDTWEIELFPSRVEWNKVSDGHKDLSLYYFLDGIRHKLLGAMGTLQVTIEPGLPRGQCSFLGMYADPTDTALPTDEDFSAWRQPDPAVPDNTIVAQLHRWDVRLASFGMDIGNQVVARRLVNHHSAVITGHDVTGSLNVELDTLTAFNPFAAAKANTLGRLKVQHGATSGRIVGIHTEACQILNPRYEDRDSIMHLMADLAIVPTNGNDDVIIYTA